MIINGRALLRCSLAKLAGKRWRHLEWVAQVGLLSKPCFGTPGAHHNGCHGPKRQAHGAAYGVVYQTG
jgi:hypothetical protein